MDTVDLGGLAAPLARLAASGDLAEDRPLADSVLRGLAAAVVWRWFNAYRDQPIPGFWRLPFGLRRPRIGQLRALLEQAFGPDRGGAAAR